jgi:hypothetical protein
MRILKAFALILLGASFAWAQSGGLINGTRGFPQPNDGTTGTTVNETAIINSSGNAVIAGTTSTTIPSYIVVGGAGTTGNAVLASAGTLAPCKMDSTIASAAGEYYVITSATTGGECHAQSAAPSPGTWVIGFLHDSATTSGSNALVAVENFVLGATSGGGTVTTTGSPASGNLTAFSGTTSITNGNLSGDVTTSGTLAATVVKVNGASVPASTALLGSNSSSQVIAAGAQYTKLRCEPGLGDGLNAIPSGTYLQSTCYNDSGVTWTITGIKCFTDNSGTSTLNAAGNTLGALLTGAITCSSSFAAGTQSANVALTSGDYIKFTFVADGTSKQTTWVVSMTQ